ncbi:septum formation protein Maf [Candidatus Woesearchaeota archaeon]|nr:septum formation protein Maf [Candidatus Woesearchaeota archaeon]
MIICSCRTVLIMDVILATGSRPKRELLETTGIPFRCVESGIDERSYPATYPSDYVVKLAIAKAEKVARANEGSLVIGADTVVSERMIILGKPKNNADALAMLQLLSGRTHTIYTGVAVCCSVAGVCATKSSVSLANITFRTIGPRLMSRYIATGEPMGKAGAYAYQGLGAHFIEKIEGDYHAVQGLPVFTTLSLLREFDYGLEQILD